MSVPQQGLRAAYPGSRRQLANIGIYLGFSLATSAIGFGSVMVLTRLLEPADYGIVGVFLSLLFFIAPLVSWSADSLIAVNRASLDTTRFQAFQRTYVGMAYACFAVLQVLFLVAWSVGAYDNLLFAATPLFGLVRFLASMAATEYVVDQRPVAFGTMTVLTSAFSLLLTIALIKLLGPWGGYRVIALLAADLLMLAVRYHGRLRLLIQPRWDREFASQVLIFGLPSLAAVAGGWCLNESDKLIVAREAGLGPAGLYAAAAALAAIMLTFNQSLTNALYPEMFRRLGRGDRNVTILTRYTIGFVCLSSTFCAAVIAVYYIVADKVLPPRYIAAGDLFVALMLAGIAVSFFRPFGLVSEYLKLGRIRAGSILLGGAVTVAIADAGVRSGHLLWAPGGIACGYVTAAIALGVGIHWYERTR